MNLCSNAEDGFVRVLNNGSFLIYFDVDYTIGEFEYSDTSGILNQGQIAQIPIPAVVSKIDIIVYKSRDMAVWTRAYHLRYYIPADYCFEIQGTFDIASMERVPCNVSSKISNCSCIKLC